MGKASRRKQERRRIVNAGTRYLDWIETRPPAPHNCVPSRETGLCRCGRRWKRYGRGWIPDGR